MKIRYTVTTTDELRSLCIKNDWFTCGTVSQYEKMFEMNRNQASLREIALVIWLCSEDEDIDDITVKLAKAKEEYVKRCIEE